MIFGALAPKFQVSATDILLDYAVIERDEADYSNILHEGTISRLRNFVGNPAHHAFEVLVHLHRYADPASKYDEIVQHKSATCKLWRHRDGKAFQDAAGSDADFVLAEYQNVYITQSDYADALRLLFLSIDAVDLSDYGDAWTMSRTLSGGSSNAWYEDPATGLLVAAADTTTSRRRVAGRLGNKTAILLEGARTNLIAEPNDFNDTGWSGTLTIDEEDTNDIKDPAGGNNATRITSSGSSQDLNYATSDDLSTDDAAGAIYLAANSEVEGDILLVAQSGSPLILATQPITITPEWTRPYVFYDNPGPSRTDDWQFSLVLDNSSETIYAYAAQLEAGAGELFPTAIIDPARAASAQETRNAESFSHPTDGYIAHRKFSVFFWFKPLWVYDEHANAMLFFTGKGTGGSGDRHSFLEILSTGSASFGMQDITGTTVGASATVSELTQNSWHHFALTCDSTVANGIKLYVDAVLKQTSTNSAFVPNPIGSSFSLGTASIPANGAFDELGTDKTIGLGNEILTLAQIKSIYNGGRLKRSLI